MICGGNQYTYVSDKTINRRKKWTFLLISRLISVHDLWSKPVYRVKPQFHRKSVFRLYRGVISLFVEEVCQCSGKTLILAENWSFFQIKGGYQFMISKGNRCTEKHSKKSKLFHLYWDYQSMVLAADTGVPKKHRS